MVSTLALPAQWVRCAEHAGSGAAVAYLAQETNAVMKRSVVFNAKAVDDMIPQWQRQQLSAADASKRNFNER